MGPWKRSPSPERLLHTQEGLLGVERGAGYYSEVAEGFDDRDTDLFLCDTNTCKFDGECLRIGNMVTCICDFKCNNDYAPVCGSNNQNYQNECFLRRDACKQQSEVLIMSEGACPAVQCSAGVLVTTGSTRWYRVAQVVQLLQAHPYVQSQEDSVSRTHRGDTRRQAVTRGELDRTVEEHQPSSKTGFCSFVGGGTEGAPARA
ncbi:unnamed protein product [Pleuronectes platessa]|uniref:Kazal-like domain-containing protein n=1 Tax=Pleuronectes platessa TaxID=8262 RepID=A0A9N7UAW0_PLEPL|nr:unnamed protein product [Pleuronectes platessa]